VIGISQSGQSPDIVSVLQEGQKQGCLTLAITNVPDSPITQAADYVIDISTGPELATAATKTYSAELMALAMLSTALCEDKQAWSELERVANWVEEVSHLDESIGQAAQRYRYMQQCVVLGRGFNYSTAFEWALKLKELTYVEAEPYSSADFMHGPIAMVQGGFPVMAVVPQGKVYGSMFDTLQQLKNNLNAELVVISNVAEALALAQIPIRIPTDVPEWLTPLVGIIPAQLFAYHLTIIKGFDPEKPRIIHKVTETR
jgi:glucosamine--fructose-6-phosphate aminotransferase (isomerizing)